MLPHNKNNRATTTPLFLGRHLWSLLFVWLGKCDVEVEKKGNVTRVFFTSLAALEMFLKPSFNTRTWDQKGIHSELVVRPDLPVEVQYRATTGRLCATFSYLAQRGDVPVVSSGQVLNAQS